MGSQWFGIKGAHTDTNDEIYFIDRVQGEIAILAHPLIHYAEHVDTKEWVYLSLVISCNFYFYYSLKYRNLYNRPSHPRRKVFPLFFVSLLLIAKPKS